MEDGGIVSFWLLAMTINADALCFAKI